MGIVVGDATTGTDILITGAGPGGYVAAIRAGQLDLDVTLEHDEAVLAQLLAQRFTE